MGSNPAGSSDLLEETHIKSLRSYIILPFSLCSKDHGKTLFSQRQQYKIWVMHSKIITVWTILTQKSISQVMAVSIRVPAHAWNRGKPPQMEVTVHEACYAHGFQKLFCI